MLLCMPEGGLANSGDGAAEDRKAPGKCQWGGSQHWRTIRCPVRAPRGCWEIFANTAGLKPCLMVHTGPAQHRLSLHVLSVHRPREGYCVHFEGEERETEAWARFSYTRALAGSCPLPPVLKGLSPGLLPWTPHPKGRAVLYETLPLSSARDTSESPAFGLRQDRQGGTTPRSGFAREEGQFAGGPRVPRCIQIPAPPAPLFIFPYSEQLQGPNHRQALPITHPDIRWKEGEMN